MKRFLISISLIAIAWLIVLYGLHQRSAYASSVNTTGVYNTSGVEQTGEHIVMGKASLSLGTIAVTLSGKAAFTSNSSYVCSLADSTGLNLTAVTYTDGSHFTITGVASDSVSFVCVGN